MRKDVIRKGTYGCLWAVKNKKYESHSDFHNPSNNTEFSFIEIDNKHKEKSRRKGIMTYQSCGQIFLPKLLFWNNKRRKLITNTYTFSSPKFNLIWWGRYWMAWVWWETEMFAVEWEKKQVHNGKHESVVELTYADGTESVDPSRDTDP